MIEGFVMPMERVFCSLKDSSWVLLSHLCFFVFVGEVWMCVLKLSFFDDGFLCSFFLSDFGVLMGFFAC